MTVDEVSWHDGVLLQWSVTPGHVRPARAELLLELYPEQIKACTRSLVLIKCQDVRRFAATCDLAELRQHAGAGNIVDGERRGRVLKLRLTGGVVQVEAMSFRLVLRPRKMSGGEAAGNFARRGSVKHGRRRTRG